MRAFRKLRLRAVSLFSRSRFEADLADELRDYLDRETEREIAAGTPPEEARLLARRSLAGLERLKEECRDARRAHWIDDSLGDLRYAARTLRKAPAFTATVVAALAFCIGANTAIFSVVDTVLFRPLPFPDQSRLVSVTEGVPKLGYPVLPFACPDYLFVAANSRSFCAAGVYRTGPYEIAGAGQPRRVQGARLTASLFHVLGVSPLLGRTFSSEEDEHAKRVAVLNYGFAESLFGNPARALGRTVLLNRAAYQIVGVMPPSFSFPIRGSRFNDDPAELFVPVSWDAEDRRQTVSNFDYSLIARLRPGATVPQANAELRILAARLVESYPASMKQAISHLPGFALEARAIPYREEFTGNVQRPLLLLLAAVGIVLLIGCADVANLMFSRMVGRQREFALRLALGAGFWRLLRQSLTEGLLLSVAGSIVGLALALLIVPALVHFAPENLPRLHEVGWTPRVAVFVVILTLVTPLLFCLAPLTGTLRSSLAPQLRGEGRTSTQNRRQRFLMSAAVVVQFSLAFVLLSAAGLLLRSFLHAAGSDPGFRPEQVLSVRLALPQTAYQTQPAIRDFFNRLLANVSALPGVRRAGAISDLPINSTSNALVSVREGSRLTQRVDTLFPLGGALESLRVPLLRGRFLQPADYASNRHVAVISESLAKQMFPGQDPIGRQIKFGVDDPSNDEPWLNVVGVAGDVKEKLTSKLPRFAVFTPPQNWVNAMYVVIRASGNPLALAGALRREVNRLDPSLPVGSIDTLDQILEQSLSAERFRTWLFASFALAAMLLATLGIAGLLAYNAARRMQEFGVRIALGANRRSLLALILRHCLSLSGAGVLVGLVASLLTGKALSALLYETSPFDPVTFFSVAALLTFVALAAAVIPAWRVLHADPVSALRAE